MVQEPGRIEDSRAQHSPVVELMDNQVLHRIDPELADRQELNHTDQPMVTLVTFKLVDPQEPSLTKVDHYTNFNLKIDLDHLVVSFNL